MIVVLTAATFGLALVGLVAILLVLTGALVPGRSLKAERERRLAAETAAMTALPVIPTPAFSIEHDPMCGCARCD